MTVYQWQNYDQYKSEANQVRDYYDSVHRCHELALQEMLREPCGSALDIACGHGESTKILEDYAHSLVGVDSSDDLIDIAIAQNEHPRTQYYCSTFEDFEAEDGSFDLVSAAWYWNHVHCESGLEEAAKKIHALLRPGGYVSFVVPGDSFTSRRIQDIAREGFHWNQAWTHEMPEATEGVFSYDDTWIRTKIWQPFFLMRKFSAWFDLSTWDVKATLVREGRLPHLCSEPPFEILYGKAR
ncbi:class I SAM-dependent methyltransferase [Rhodopirellula sallentina]|uniref:Methyltransferase type 11 domain protein n=1 Tax=Rhodopirellula sallentina SM41 TaxID=1263870 RepID=M5UDI1_9BACT|nr:class I SAM-dependent methyltransferase [Rhodopirellula sallentina]EMI55911.1 Methyltransferase type 11 domain protein [Rhodopirellula sallentina SM41]